ncbi:hypothetical protein [Flavobacterium lipolyticum]|uniref:Uncharacterized protein n=1 Tax=Flavobacterium lipolyticum TaxID=2893754 RepID=A0ABS8M8B0_9FLAO|nr:hypothetical protein [Flavobacterium sp. F-126]MCC9020406.1 hypothetical protein [Flavobacterium sp. F-126]
MLYHTITNTSMLGIIADVFQTVNRWKPHVLQYGVNENLTAAIYSTLLKTLKD